MEPGLSWPGSGANVGLVIGRRPLEGDLRTMVAREVRELRAKLRSCVLDDESEGVLGGEPGLVVGLRYVREGMPFYHRQIFVAARGRLLTFVASGPAADRDAIDTLFDSALAGFRFRE